MSSDEIHAILRAPRKLILALAALAIGSGGLSVVAHFNDYSAAELSECRALVEHHAATIAELESRRVGIFTDLRPVHERFRENPFEGHK